MAPTERDDAILRPFGSKHGVGCTALAGLGLGFVGGVHAAIAVYAAWGGSTALSAWSAYAFALCFFHASEFLTTALFKPRDVSFDSWLLDHSLEYKLAALASALEFWIERYFFPTLKQTFPITMALGLCVVVLGNGVRMVAMWQCGENFSHVIMTSRDDKHKLVTDGVYAYLRHPAYFGWFWWSVGTQVLLSNPICFIGYFWASRAFFAHRIPYEEATLHHFYPVEYAAYVRRSRIGIPFIQFIPRTPTIHD
ncbi:isoprenylcysteine carboxyl methyltransferase putative [Pelagophyceae sp. CCMP2097]|nr:isoprenylcysteine carboxyl methyltransferase putative [Pelagophyceae sp. CCMP2097]